jgi:hypothetical protein
MMRILLARGMKPTDIVYQYSLNDPFENMNLHYPKRYMSKPASYLDGAGELKFRSLPYEVGIYDSDALFLTSDGEIGVLPVVGNKVTPHRIIADQIKKMSQPSIWNDSYLVGLTKAAIGVLMTPKITVEQVEKKFPYIKADYIPDDFGGFSPGFIDVSWEEGSYPIKLLRKIILVMKSEAEASGARFWISLPLGTPNPTRAFLAEITKTDGLRVIDPFKMGVTDKWIARCGGYLVFKTDGHYTACGHTGQAEAIITALSETK